MEVKWHLSDKIAFISDEASLEAPYQNEKRDFERQTPASVLSR
jgi:hypothetical protein